MTIEEIYYSEDISVRSFNVCNDNGLKDLNSVLRYYQENKTFNNLRNCGKKSNEELIAICLKYIDKEKLGENESAKTENPLIYKISNLTRTQREIVNSFIEINFNNLTNRSKNAIGTFLNGNLKIRNLSERILTNKKFKIQDIKNVGAKSTTELNSFIGLINSFVENVSNTTEENELISMKNRFFLEKSFSISKIPTEILETLSIFKLTEFLLSNNVIFENNRSTIFKKAFKLYQNQLELTLDEIADELNLSRERVRQVRKSISEDLLTNFNFIRNIEDDLFQKYRIDLSQDVVFVDGSLSDFVNESNGTNFSKEFISFLIYVYTCDTFSLVGITEDVLLLKNNNSRDRHNWECFYLIKSEIFNKFQFNEFANDIHKRLNERIEETYKFNFKSFLSNFLIDNNFDFLEKITTISEKIINNEFGIYLDLEDNLVFSRNTLKTIPEYAMEALEDLGVPSKVEEIYRVIEKRYPEITKSKESLRGSLQKTAEIIYFGRSSTYGLKKWEIEREGIRGGTIKDIVMDYLKYKDSPIHVFELLEEVHKFREQTNAKNIITNLKLDPQKQFVIYNQNFVGLSGKTYNSKLTGLPKFLGKTITYYIKRHNIINRINVEEYFLSNLEISKKNMNYIIENLIESGFILIDNKNNLYI